MIWPVILSGGAGTRLWPLSRPDRPKQFLALAGERTMLQETVARASGDGFHPPVIVANEAHLGLLDAQLADAGRAPAAILLEPVARNTAPAIALAAHWIAAREPRGLMLVMPSDHVIGDVAAFHSAIAKAQGPVADGWLATFGIAPDGPETGYGYIQRGAPVADGVFAVDRFVEKPDRATAEAYLADGGYLWNGGIFLFRADRYLEGLQRHAPAIAQAAADAAAGAASEGNIVRPDPDAFAASPSDSIDYAVMEKDGRVAVVPVTMGWSDIGSWDALRDRFADADGNLFQGRVAAIDTRDTQVQSDGRPVALIGVEGLHIVVTADAVLIAAKGRSQEVKAVQALLARETGD